VFCQNHQISQGMVGSVTSPQELSETMLRLQAQGCSTIEPVSPAHHLPGLLEALALAVERGLRLPLVYNTNGYESSEALDLLDGIVDVYLPDLKYADEHHALQFSGVSDYVEIARSAVLQMHGQVGTLVVDLYGHAVQGLVIRHLVLPEDVSGTASTLTWIWETLPRTVTISLMAQYSPLHLTKNFPPLDRAITQREYDQAVDFALNLGFEHVFVQDPASQHIGVPDFKVDNPFNWC
jgi:putative pyruvate formate lyase activating enzyme